MDGRGWVTLDRLSGSKMATTSSVVIPIERITRLSEGREWGVVICEVHTIEGVIYVSGTTGEVAEKIVEAEARHARILRGVTP